ncbi:hypothetical protein Scep_010392 [Stephania cephalantha]|uniref:Uncharacterized protein n=1 Tax=Stephania cephalantha TaxID=152367 RepID=A0AAP0PH71_9MAGN
MISHQSWWSNLVGERSNNGNGGDGAVTTTVEMLGEERDKSTTTRDNNDSDGGGGGEAVGEGGEEGGVCEKLRFDVVVAPCVRRPRCRHDAAMTSLLYWDRGHDAVVASCIQMHGATTSLCHLSFISIDDLLRRVYKEHGVATASSLSVGSVASPPPTARIASIPSALIQSYISTPHRQRPSVGFSAARYHMTEGCGSGMGSGSGQRQRGQPQQSWEQVHAIAEPDPTATRNLIEVVEVEIEFNLAKSKEEIQRFENAFWSVGRPDSCPRASESTVVLGRSGGLR